MSRRFTRLFLLSVLAISSNAWAIGLGDIKLNSALNEPLRAEIALLSATPDEITGLTVALASDETFRRYGINRPFYLQGIEFNIENDGVGGSVVHLKSTAPITEVFLTFLVEANWASGRLLREYTVLLDPPTYAPPSVQQATPVAAPRRSTPSDSGRIERRSEPEPVVSPPARSTGPSAPRSRPRPQSQSQPVADDRPYDTAAAGDVVVARGDTLWGLAARMRPDSRLTMNQTMLAIYEANRGAFGGNINLLREGASLRIPSAEEIFQISRGDASSEVQRQHSAWDTPGDGGSVVDPATTTRPSLTLVPPDEEPVDTDYDGASTTYEPLTREDEIENRIRELEEGEVPDQYSLIEIRDNELASLRQELATIRGEIVEPPVDDSILDTDIDDVFVDEVFVDDDQAADDAADSLAVDSDELPADDDAAVPDVEDTAATTAADDADEGILDKILGYASSFWGLIVAAVVVVIGLLVWFMRRGSDDDDDARPWESLDAEDDIGIGALSATETMHAPVVEEAIVVVEQDTGLQPVLEDTVDVPETKSDDDETGSFGSLEDTFSSDTAVNLDQTDPIAEADFHMAYGLYDQAADLINGALESEPSDKALMSKLCEIYFVWGNRDSFVDAATRLKSAIGTEGSSDWDKIVIMGQQIAADHKMFAGAGVAGVTREVDLSFDDDGDQDGALDMDFDAQTMRSSEVIDLGQSDGESSDDVDFLFDDATAENQTVDMPVSDATADMPTQNRGSPTIDENFADFDDGTSELPSLDGTLGQAVSDSGLDSNETAEINLDELDLDVAGLAETEIASLDDPDATGQMETLVDTGVNEALGDAADVTGRNPEVDPGSTGIRQDLDIGDIEDLDETSEMRLATDETGRSPSIDAEDEIDTGIDIDASLLDATGMTQVLGSDMAVDTVTGMVKQITDDDATLLAPGLGDDDDFDFAKTEALPKDSFGSDADETAGTPAIAETDVDLDLDDLTAALKVSEAGDTVEQIRDAETVEQPRPTLPSDTAEFPTVELSPDDISGDLQEARTMTEVGTKLDLARAYVDMGDPAGARSILDEVLDEGDEAQKQQAQKLLDSLPT